MHALGVREVEATLSAVARYRAGLTRPKPHEAGGQDLGGFVEPLGGGHAIWRKRIGELHSEPSKGDAGPQDLLTPSTTRPKAAVFDSTLGRVCDSTEWEQCYSTVSKFDG